MEAAGDVQPGTNLEDMRGQALSTVEEVDEQGDGGEEATNERGLAPSTDLGAESVGNQPGQRATWSRQEALSLWEAIAGGPPRFSEPEKVGRARIRLPSTLVLPYLPEVEPRLSNLANYAFTKPLLFQRSRYAITGVDARFRLMRVHSKQPESEVEVGRTHYLARGDVHYAKTRRPDVRVPLALQPTAAPIVSPVMEKTANNAAASLHLLFPARTPPLGAGLSQRMYSIVQRVATERYVVPHTVIWRMAAVYLAAAWGSMSGVGLSAVPSEAVEVHHVRTMDEWAATVLRTEANANYAYVRAQGLRGGDDDLLALLSVVLSQDMGLTYAQGHVMPSVVVEPPPLRGLSLVWISDHGPPRVALRFHPSQVWAAACVISNQWGSLELFQGMVRQLAMCWFATDPALGPVYGAAHTQFSIPELNLVGTMLLPLSLPDGFAAEGIEWPAEPQPEELFQDGLLAGMLVNACSRDLLCSVGGRLARNTYLAKEDVAKIVDLTTMRKGGWGKLVPAAESLATAAGMRGSFGGGMYGCVPDLGNPSKVAAWASDDRNAVQWEELMCVMQVVPASSVMAAIMRPAMLLTPPKPGQWVVRRQGGAQDPRTWAIMRAMDDVGAEVGALFYADGSRGVRAVADLEAWSYRRIRSDFAFFPALSFTGGRMLPAFRCPDADTVARATELFGLARGAEWYLGDIDDDLGPVDPTERNIWAPFPPQWHTPGTAATTERRSSAKGQGAQPEVQTSGDAPTGTRAVEVELVEGEAAEEEVMATAVPLDSVESKKVELVSLQWDNTNTDRAVTRLLSSRPHMGFRSPLPEEAPSVEALTLLRHTNSGQLLGTKADNEMWELLDALVASLAAERQGRTPNPQSRRAMLETLAMLDRWRWLVASTPQVMVAGRYTTPREAQRAAAMRVRDVLRATAKTAVAVAEAAIAGILAERWDGAQQTLSDGGAAYISAADRTIAARMPKRLEAVERLAGGDWPTSATAALAMDAAVSWDKLAYKVEVRMGVQQLAVPTKALESALTGMMQEVGRATAEVLEARTRHPDDKVDAFYCVEQLVRAAVWDYTGVFGLMWNTPKVIVGIMGVLQAHPWAPRVIYDLADERWDQWLEGVAGGSSSPSRAPPPKPPQPPQHGGDSSETSTRKQPGEPVDSRSGHERGEQGGAASADRQQQPLVVTKTSNQRGAMAKMADMGARLVGAMGRGQRPGSASNTSDTATIDRRTGEFEHRSTSE